MLSTEKKNSFAKKEKLCSKILIEKLFKEGKNEFAYPFKFLYLEKEIIDDELPKILIIVNKKGFKKATDRNLLKRRTREAYRIKKNDLFKDKKNHFILCAAFIFIAKEKVDFKVIQNGIQQIIKKINKKFSI
ncbi:MAG: ribonuclease P protein component [Cytophagales bacterium]|nr:MAG: ribonuclease P protein component [Cytophagales bacterium]TAH29551.1 MAG: ribonuclease P protein component [Cytophagales bacterium]